MITKFKLHPNHIKAEYEIYIPLNTGITKEQALKCIMSTLEAQVMIDFKEIKFV